MTVDFQEPAVFRFISVSKTSSRANSRRAIELANADARSHAAHVSHLLRRKSASSKRRSAVVPRRHSSRHDDTQNYTSPTQTDKYVSSCLLDPFIQLPVDLPLADRNLLHGYLTLVPQAVYNTSSASAFCPVRHTTLISIATNTIWLSWVILCMHHQLTLFQARDPWREAPLLHRRKMTLELMNEKLKAPENEMLSDETLYGIVSAGVIEYRLGCPKEATKHLEAGLRLFEMRKKKDANFQITYPVGLILCNAYIASGVIRFFTNTEALAITSASISQRLTSMQTWNREFRQCVSNGKHSPVLEGEKPILGHPSEEYISSRHQIGAENSIIRGHVRLMLEDTSTSGTRICLGALFAMNTTIWACRHNESEALEYITELLYYLRESEPKAVADGTPKLTQMAAMYIVGYCGSNVQQRYGATRTRFDLYDAVKFVEVMMLAGDMNRVRMKLALASWLLVAEDEPEDLVLWTDSEMAVLGSEVSASWEMKQLQMLGDGM